MSNEPNIRSDLRCTFHEDGTISVWDCIVQQWRRIEPEDFTDVLLATLDDGERDRIRDLQNTSR